MYIKLNYKKQAHYCYVIVKIQGTTELVTFTSIISHK